MTNTEKLRSLMREYGVEKCYYSHDMNLDEERPNGEIFFIGEDNAELALKAYEIFTEDGVVDEEQSLVILIFTENSDSFKIQVTPEMKVLYANI